MIGLMPPRLPSPIAAAPTPEAPFAPLSTFAKVANLVVIIGPAVALVAGIACLWGRGFSWVQLGLFLGMYVVTTLGITVGFHRLFTHRAFEAPAWVGFILAALGSMAIQGPLLQWVATHRRHHQHSDRPGDPHSPHTAGPGLVGLLRGIWHSHIGWMFAPNPRDLARYSDDLRRSRALRVVSALFPVWATAGMLIPAALGGLLTWTWEGAVFGLLWGGLARLFLTHHVTWSVNSVCHLWGSRPYRGTDRSRNNLVFGVLALGEGWHNNHHAFPTSARHGLKWWQIDVSYWLIRGLALVGLAWNVRLPATRSPAA